MRDLLDLSQQITPEIVEPQIIWEVKATLGNQVVCIYRSFTSLEVYFSQPLADMGMRRLIDGFRLEVFESPLL